MNIQKENRSIPPSRLPRPEYLAKTKYSPQNNSIKSAVSKILSLIVEFAVALLAAIAYPFAAVDYNPKTLPPTCKKVTILVHGFFHNSTAWAYLKQRFQKCPDLGPIFTINLGHPYHTIADYTDVLKKEIVRIHGMNPGEKLEVNLVGHSMGGLVSINYAVNQSEDDPIHVANVVTVASPIKGTKIAKYGSFIPCVNEMNDLSQFTKDLNEKMALKKGTNFSHLEFEEDVISPCYSKYSMGANTKVFPRLGHLACLLSPLVADHIIKCLRSEPISY